MLVGPATYLFTGRAGHVIKVGLVQPFTTSKTFPSEKQAVGSFLDVKPTHFAVIAAPQEK